MPQDVCLDANVFVSALLPEPLHDRALSLVDRLQAAGLVFFEPGLVIFEVISVLYRKRVLGEIKAERLEQATGLFAQFPLLIEWQPGVLVATSKWAERLKMRNAYDASYLAVAETRGVPFVTFDQELIHKAKPYYRHVWSVESFLHSELS